MGGGLLSADGRVVTTEDAVNNARIAKRQLKWNGIPFKNFRKSSFFAIT